jgi:hypothetical protein
MWTNEQLAGMGDTISTLRRMRTVATGAPSMSLRERLSVLFKKPQIDEDVMEGQRQGVLYDAEHLASAAGTFFASHISHTHEEVKAQQAWLDGLSDALKKYGKFRETTYRKTETFMVATASLVSRLRYLSIDPTYVLDWELTQNNNLGLKEIGELRSRNIGVVSPLSGDYLMACVYRSYLKIKHGNTFAVSPAALSRDVRTVVLQRTPTGTGVFDHTTRIGMYMDTTQSGNTGKVLYAAVKAQYPKATVYEPPVEFVEFIPSKRINEFKKKANE